MNQSFKPLLESLQLKNNVELKNRVVLAPMTNFSSHPDGTVSDAEIDYYVRRSKGAGMVITACTNVTANGKGFHGEFGGDHDGMIPSLSRLASSIKEQGAKAVLQIFHGGGNARQSSFLMVKQSVRVRLHLKEAAIRQEH